MNREGIKENRAVFDAWLEGADIQYRWKDNNGPWEDCPFPGWLPAVDYRVKPDNSLYKCRINSSDTLKLAKDGPDLEIEITNAELDQYGYIYLPKSEALRLSEAIKAYADNL